ncbi:uncharacterized protein DS421_4g123580 [Arachis hypogaea]|nr:uncharacterized protein DS421_4g123580 [Arachis hypogaea]
MLKLQTLNLLCVPISAFASTLVKILSTCLKDLVGITSKGRTIATALAGRHADGSLHVEDFIIEVKDQSGKKVQLGFENDQRAVMMGLMLDANEKLLIRQETTNMHLKFLLCERYFLAEIEGPEQKSDLEDEKGLQMLLDSDLPALEINFLELQKPNWRALNCFGK